MSDLAATVANPEMGTWLVITRSVLWCQIIRLEDGVHIQGPSDLWAIPITAGRDLIAWYVEKPPSAEKTMAGMNWNRPA